MSSPLRQRANNTELNQLPPGQGRHDELPVSFWYVLLAQASGAALNPAHEKPAGQSTHAVPLSYSPACNKFAIVFVEIYFIFWYTKGSEFQETITMSISKTKELKTTKRKKKKKKKKTNISVTVKQYCAAQITEKRRQNKKSINYLAIVENCHPYQFFKSNYSFWGFKKKQHVICHGRHTYCIAISKHKIIVNSQNNASLTIRIPYSHIGSAVEGKSFKIIFK